MKTGFFLLILLFLAAPAAPAERETVAGLPLHIQKLDEGVVRVWLGDHISSTATVAFATEKGVVVIDTTGDPKIDTRLRQIIARELGRDDFITLINTHEHGDHTGGNAVYADCEIVGHDLVVEAMHPDSERQTGMMEWLTTRIAELEGQLADLPAGSPEAEVVREQVLVNRLELEAASAENPSVPPTRAFSDRLVLDFGDLTCELFYIGGMHSASDIAVLVPERGLLLTGDTMANVWLTDTPGCLASFIARPGVEHDFPCLLKNWNALLARQNEIKQLVTGHWNGELTWDGFAKRVALVHTLWDGTTAMAGSGGTVQDMLTDFRLADRFPELAESPGCSQGNTSTTILEMWTEVTGQRSAARALFGLLEEGAEEAKIQAVLAARTAEPAPYYFIESQINGWGYRFLQTERPEQAASMFRVNVQLYPDSWNAHDSLGESLLALGDTEGARQMYLKSLELNPDNTNGANMLEQIKAGAVAN
jgi:glyoxylase-like metal-dependent hydrolase (beta-lactamase superfamily II)